MSITRELLLAMLRQDDPDLTASDVSALVDEHAKSLTYVIEKVGEAVAAAFGGDKQEKNVPKPTAKTK
jgi:hypothetical protein